MKSIIKSEDLSEICESYNKKKKKIPKTIVSFKRSPTKNDILQSYVRIKIKKNLQLILDSRTRWSSLLDMLQRFLLLKVPLQKAIEELTAFTADDFEIIQTIILTLESTENYSSSFVQIWT